MSKSKVFYCVDKDDMEQIIAHLQSASVYYRQESEPLANSSCNQLIEELQALMPYEVAQGTDGMVIVPAE